MSDWTYVLRIPLPDEYGETGPDWLETMLIGLSRKAQEDELPPTGELWDRQGNLLAHAEIVEEASS